MTACFALMVGPQGCAIGVEHIPELVATSIKNIEKSAAAPLLKEGSLQLHVGGRQWDLVMLTLQNEKEKKKGKKKKKLRL